jgi:hypothetical protein
MAATVSRQENQPLAIELAKQQFIGGHAEWRSHLSPLRIFQSIDVVDAAPAEHTYNRLIRYLDVRAPRHSRGQRHGCELGRAAATGW